MTEVQITADQWDVLLAALALIVFLLAALLVMGFRR